MAETAADPLGWEISRYQDRLDQELRGIEELRGQLAGRLLGARLDEAETRIINEIGRVSRLREQGPDGRAELLDLVSAQGSETGLYAEFRALAEIGHQIRQGSLVVYPDPETDAYYPRYLRERAEDNQGLLPDGEDDVVADKPYAWYLATLEHVKQHLMGPIGNLSEAVVAASRDVDQWTRRVGEPVQLEDLWREEQQALEGIGDATTVEEAVGLVRQKRIEMLLWNTDIAHRRLSRLDALRAEVRELWREDPTEDQPAETPEQ